MKRFNSYKAYTVGCVIAWAVLWIVVGIQSSETTQERVLFVVMGWLLGWTSATIARAVYPPPTHCRSN
jgi:4-hydroxybenzoate polyprenyltransferase